MLHARPRRRPHFAALSPSLMTLASLAALSSPALAVPSGHSDVCYNGGPTLVNFQLNENAALNGQSIVITQDTGNQRGSVMYRTPFSATDDFHIKMEVKITTDTSYTPADGMTFVMHNAPAGAGAIGDPGGGIGYQGIPDSVVVEFDTYVNGWDPGGPHIAITRNGNADHNSPTNSGLPTPVLFSDLTPAVDPVGGLPFFIWIDYAAAATKLEVFVAQTDSKPTTAALSTTGINLATSLGSTFFMGFTGSTGGAWSKHEFLQLYATDNGATATANCCAGDADCGSSPAGSLCDPQKHVCGTCTLADTSTCPSGNGACDASGAHNVCAIPCDGNFGSAAQAACSSANYPSCRLSGVGAGSCSVCAGDQGAGSSADCGSGAPFCSPSGYCGLCTSNNDCTAAGATHAGAFCNDVTGGCVSSCVVDSDCGTQNVCVGGSCAPKPANGSPVPGGTCSGPAAARCASGVCSPSNDTCGYVTGTGGCTTANAATVCQSGACSPNGHVCVPATSGACYVDGDCTSGYYCDRAALACAAKLPSGAVVANDGLHDGTCASAAAVCASGLCNSATNTCADANGAACTAARNCRYNLCGSDGHCGATDGETGCTSGNAATYCQSGTCSAGGTCIPAAANSCYVDADCADGSYCDRNQFTCATKLADGAALTGDGLHDGTCTTANATAVCNSGLCNPTTVTCGAGVGGPCTAAAGCADNLCGSNGKCGQVAGEGACTATNAATVCQSGACGAHSGVCVPADTGGCGTDADCADGSYCNGSTFHCATKLTAGSPLPSDGTHAACAADANAACASGRCNATTNTCADANGAACTAANQCVRNACGGNGKCGLADGQRGCTSATASQCQSGVCGGSGVCGSAGCGKDADCPTTAYCDGSAGLCHSKLIVGQPLPSDGVHDGGCTLASGQAICASGACNPTTKDCALPTGAACTTAQSCATGVCGGNGKCGLADGEGPCNAATQTTACQSGLCNAAAQQCQPSGAGRCVRDADCVAGSYCDRARLTCATKLPDGGALPADGLHDGACNAAEAAAVCASGACNATTRTCGANAGGACTDAKTCASNICFTDGQCALPTGLSCTAASDCRSGQCTDGVCGAGPAPRSIGGGGGCDFGNGAPVAPSTIGLAVALAAMTLTRSRHRRQR